MKRVLLITVLLLLPATAWAVVRPPDEWFDSPAKFKLWEEWGPKLKDVEFGQRKLLTGEVQDSVDGIQQHLGLANNAVAQELGLPADAADVLKYDLNLDGRVDQFDVLEAGYQVIPSRKHASIAPSHGTNQWIVLRADFSDIHASATYSVAYFNDRLFTAGGGAVGKPSLHDFYNETSYGALDIEGTVSPDGPYYDGWYRGDQTRSWYHNNGGDWLVREAVLDADPTVDFSDFDVDHDGYVDSLCVYYPGPVQWGGGLHPHRSSGLNISVDGVIVDSYFLSVVDTAADSWLMEISSHEYGHILGLPDLYDVDGGSNGCGNWDLMAYQYDGQQRIPSVDPWCKIQLGWVTPTVIADDVTGYNLGCYETTGQVLKVWTDGKDFSQYFLLANYRKTGTDQTRPGQGLLIWHIDDTIAGGDADNANEYRKHVDVESARGFDDPDSATGQDPLDNGTDEGHANDPFFSGNSAAVYNGTFNSTSNPRSKSYPHPYSETYVAVSNISASADTMTLDVAVESPDAPSVTIDAPAADSTITGSTTIDATATPGTDRTIDHLAFYCNGAYLGSDSSEPYSLAFDSRAIYDGTREIKVVAVDNTGAIDTAAINVTASNSAVALGFTDGFESGIGQWASYNFHGSRYWESKSGGSAGSFSAGVGSATGGYDYDEHDNLVSVRFDLPAGTPAVARWKQMYRVAGGENTCKVFITTDDGATFTMLKTNTGSNLTWHPQAVDLTAYAGQEAYLVFRLDSSSLNRASGEAGWWIDEFEIHAKSAPPQILSITPGEGSELTGNQLISVDATDDEGITAMDFIIDGDDELLTDYAAPWEYTWNSDWVFNGSHTFTAQAYDADLQVSTATVNWTTNNPGLSMPYTESFTTDPGTAWRIDNPNGAGEWQWINNVGYGGGGGMRFCIPGQSVYDDNESDIFLSPTLYITGLTNPGIGWVHKWDIEANYDYARVYVTTDLENWTQLGVWSSTNAAWQASGASLSSYNNQRVKLAFFFQSDGGLVHDGWWVDELLLTSAPVIDTVAPNPVVNSQTLTITGTNFGAGPAVDFKKVTISGTSATITGWNDTTITVTVPANVASGNVVVYRRGIPSNNKAVTIKLPAPNLSGLGQL